MANSKVEECPVSCSNDVVAGVLGRVGVTRSCLITLALLPFSWSGVVWFADALRSLWELVSGVGN